MEKNCTNGSKIKATWDKIHKGGCLKTTIKMKKQMSKLFKSSPNTFHNFLLKMFQHLLKINGIHKMHENSDNK